MEARRSGNEGRSDWAEQAKMTDFHDPNDGVFPKERADFTAADSPNVAKLEKRLSL